MFKELCDLRKYYGAEGNLFVFRQEGGKKCHLAEFLFDNALKKGELKKGMPVAEITAGNFGLALAKLCAKNKSRLYLVPIGKLDSKTLKRLKKSPPETAHLPISISLKKMIWWNLPLRNWTHT